MYNELPDIRKVHDDLQSCGVRVKYFGKVTRYVVAVEIMFIRQHDQGGCLIHHRQLAEENALEAVIKQGLVR